MQYELSHDDEGFLTVFCRDGVPMDYRDVLKALNVAPQPAEAPESYTRLVPAHDPLDLPTHITLNAEESAAMEARMAEPARMNPRLTKLMQGTSSQLVDNGTKLVEDAYKRGGDDLKKACDLKLAASAALLDQMGAALQMARNRCEVLGVLAGQKDYDANVKTFLPQFDKALAAYNKHKAA